MKYVSILKRSVCITIAEYNAVVVTTNSWSPFRPDFAKRSRPAQTGYATSGQDDDQPFATIIGLPPKLEETSQCYSKKKLLREIMTYASFIIYL